MNAATISRDSTAAGKAARANGRAYERYPSELPTQCQPLAARGDKDLVWQATVHDISAGGIGLLLQRRFEPRTGLAIELPDVDNSTYTVFVRVAHATPRPQGRWLLGCSFVSPLSEERLKALLRASKKRAQAKLPPQIATVKLPCVSVERCSSVIHGVHFRAKLPDGSVLSRSVTRLHITGSWPMRRGRIVSVWVGKGKRNGAAVALRVNDCHQEGGQWFIDCTFVATPPAEMVRSLNKKRPA